MRRVNFTSNWNGKLCNDVFTTIRPYDYDKYPEFEKFEVALRDQVLGIAELAAKKAFKGSAINDITSLVDCGHTRDYLVKLLHNFYKDMGPDKTLYLLVFKWEERFPEPTEQLFKSRYEKIQEAFPQTKSSQPELFDHGTI